MGRPIGAAWPTGHEGDAGLGADDLAQQRGGQALLDDQGRDVGVEDDLPHSQATSERRMA
ncbi:MAG: hypothetical protein L0I24_07565 [Pseudonocardia sp.]|nr:hypothetical protein [Pseudonocardia sp.]